MIHNSYLFLPVVLKNVLVFTAFKYILLKQKIAKLFTTSIGWLSYHIIRTSRYVITLIDQEAHSIYIYVFNCVNVLHCVTPTTMLSAYLHSCMSPYANLFRISNSSSQSFPLLFQMLFQFPRYSPHFRACFLIFNYLSLWKEYLSAEILWDPPLFVWGRWHGRSGSPREPWQLCANGSLGESGSNLRSE